MKKLFTVFALAGAILVTAPAQAQVKFGLKGGVNLTNLSLSSSISDQAFSKSNQSGFFIGPTVKASIPLAGLGVDASVFYDQRDSKLGYEDDGKTKVSQKSVVIPINLRYGVGLGSIASVYLAAGPQFGFNVGDDSFKLADAASYDIQKSNFSVNVGAGVSLISHLELGVTYNIACGKTSEVNALKVAGDAMGQVAKGRANAWQVSAAYFF